MAQFDFYGSQEDWYPVLEALLERPDIRLTPGRNYTTMHPKAYSEIDDSLRENLREVRRFFITGDFSKHPLWLREYRRTDYAGVYSIDERRGGPALSLTLPMCNKLDERFLYLGPGDLFCHNIFWSDDDEYKAPPDVKAAYVELRKRVRSRLKKRQIADETIWIGDGGIGLLDRGEALILRNGNWLDASGRFVKSNTRGAAKGDRAKRTW
jgi:hypothetical protein